MALHGSLEPSVQHHQVSKAGDGGRKAPDTARLEAALGHRFADQSLLATALTHMSADQRRLASYQRLEFLGDRVLGLSIADMLFTTFPQAEEGDMSRRLADLVRKETCAEVAAAWELGPNLRLGEAMAEPRLQPREFRQLAAGFSWFRHLIVVNMRFQRTVQGHSQRRQAEAPSSIEKKRISARPTKYSKGT